MIGSRAWLLCVIALLAWAGTQASSAQDSAQPARPRIGLALGGGSARGFAHIGVLEWLEKHHIPVDYVVGTSMGGLMEVIYATGMPPREIRALVNSINWDELFLAEAPYALKEFRRKQDQRSYPARLELGLKHGVRLQGGLDPGEPVLLLIDRLILPYSANGSFDDLPIPFRCVAVDMVRAQQVILKDGPLTTALRATMSLPAIFNPVERDGRILADGGLMNNVPADVARAMGADIVIAVDVGAEAPDAAALQNLSEVLNRILAQVGYLHRIARLPTFLGGNAYVGGLLQHGSAFEDLDSADFHTDLASGFYVDTILGPAFFGGSVGEGGRSRLYSTIGQLF